MRFSSSKSRRAQQGYVLLVILLALVIVIIGLTAAAPAIKQQLQRDREEEMIHRGRQYAIAIKKFYKKFGRYPVRLEELDSTNNLRFLRRHYKNPTDPNGEWRILHMGEVKSTIKIPGQPGQPIGQNIGTPVGAPQTTGGTPPDQSGGGQSGDNSGGKMGAGQPGIGTPVSGLPGASSGPVFGGGPIVGVAGTVNKKSIKVWNDKDAYKDWEFFYDPRLDALQQGGGAPGGQPGQQPGQSGPTGPPTPQPGPGSMPPDIGPPK